MEVNEPKIRQFVDVYNENKVRLIYFSDDPEKAAKLEKWFAEVAEPLIAKLREHGGYEQVLEKLV